MATLSADRAFLVGLDPDHSSLQIPGRKQGFLAGQRSSVPFGEVAEGQARLPGGRYPGGGSQDATRIARREGSRGRELIELAAKARGFVPREKLDMARASNGTGVNPGDLETVAHVVQEEPGGDVVRAVQDQICARGEIQRIRGVEVLGMDLQENIGVDSRKPGCQGLRLEGSLPRVGLLEAGLALEVRPLHDITVDEPQDPDSRSSQVLGRVASQSPAAHDEDSSSSNARLPLLPNGTEEDLPEVAVGFHGIR